MEELGNEKDTLLQKKLKTIGNYVHDSVPMSNTEVRVDPASNHWLAIDKSSGRQCCDS